MSQPSSKTPSYFAMSSACACNGQCGAVYATYRKNGVVVRSTNAHASFVIASV
jgi:hypothetical protein